MVNKSRDKDIDRDSSDIKKHRKTNSTSSSSNASEIPSIKAKVDVYAVCVHPEYNNNSNFSQT